MSVNNFVKEELMKKSSLCGALLLTIGAFSGSSLAAEEPKFITEQDAIQAALAELGVNY